MYFPFNPIFEKYKYSKSYIIIQYNISVDIIIIN